MTPRKKKRLPNPSSLVMEWVKFCGLGIPAPVQEFQFAAPVREWAFDFAWPTFKVALEIEGGAWTRGRHTRGAGFVGDIEKYNEAWLRGWGVIRATPSHVRSQVAFGWLTRAFGVALLNRAGDGRKVI